MADLTMPKMGFDMEEGTIVRWIKKVGDDVKTEVQADLDALNEALKGEDADAVQAAVTKLGESSSKMGEAMYAAAAADAQASGAEGGAPTDSVDDDDVVEAEIVDDEPAEGSEGEQK